jgi:hypothetical protein
MRPQDSVWQGCFGYWQNLFIRENLLSLENAAWQGFITQGRGMVVCDVVMADVAMIPPAPCALVCQAAIAAQSPPSKPVTCPPCPPCLCGSLHLHSRKHHPTHA